MLNCSPGPLTIFESRVCIRSAFDQWSDSEPYFPNMATNVDIEGLANDWDSVQAIRDRMRRSRTLFLDTVNGTKLEVNIKGAEAHSDVLTPLLKKLVDSEAGSIGMCSIPALEAEQLVVDIVCIFGRRLFWYNSALFKHDLPVDHLNNHLWEIVGF